MALACCIGAWLFDRHSAQAMLSFISVFIFFCTMELDEIFAMAQETCQEVQSAGQRRAETMRAGKQRKKARLASEAGSVQAEAIDLAVLTIPGCSSILQRQPAPLQLAPMHALMRLALSPRVRGSGSSVDRVRLYQNVATALLARAALDRQSDGYDLWTSPERTHREGDMRGFVGMWDEASQKARSLFGVGPNKGQKVVEVFVLLASIFQCRLRNDGSDSYEWQPWLAPPLCVPDTKHLTVLAALEQALPFCFSDPDTLLEFGRGVDIALLCFTFDMAASNVAVYSRMQKMMSILPEQGGGIMLHGERCLTHALHIVKSDIMAQDGISGMLYSFSKIVASSRSLKGLSDALTGHIRAHLEVRHGQAPPQDELLAVLKRVMGLDRDDYSLHRDTRGSSKERKKTVLLRDLEEACARCHFEGDRWLYFSPLQAGRVNMSSLGPSDMVSFIADPLLRLFVGRRWQVAAVSRWTGTISVLKKMVIGCIMGNILPVALSGLGANMELTEDRVNRMLERVTAAQARGEEVGDGEIHWAAHCRRVLRISLFFQNPCRRWQMGVVLLAASIVDRLHWAVLGSKDTPRLQLRDLVDQKDSHIAKLMRELLAQLDDWSLDNEHWMLLRYLGLEHLHDVAVMDFTRALLVRQAAGLFLCAEHRLSVWPYRLWLLASPNCTEHEKGLVIKDFLAASPCCLGPFGRRFRNKYPTRELLRDATRRPLIFWNELQRFTTYHVEAEHKVIKDDCRSDTSGVTFAPVCHRAVCKLLHAAHVQKGNKEMALPLRRVARRLADTGSCLALSRVGAAALEDIDTASPSAIADAPARNPGQTAGQLQVSRLGGGNPKVCFINAKLQEHKEIHGVCARDVVSRMRTELAKEYDASEEIRARWTTIWQGVRAIRTRPAQQASCSGGSSPSSQVMSSLSVWPETYQRTTEKSDYPLAPQIVADYRSTFYPSSAQLQQLAYDDVRFRVQDKTFPTARYEGWSCFPCGGQPRSACRLGLADAGRLQAFDTIRQALNRYLCKLPRPEVRAAKYLFLLKSIDEAGVLHQFWVLLAKVVYSPQMQVFVRCCHENEYLSIEDCASKSWPYPYSVLMEQRASRFQDYESAKAMDCLDLLTSEDLVGRMLSASTAEWSIVPLRHRTDPEEENLLTLLVEGEDPGIPLIKAGRDVHDESFLAWLTMPRCPTASGSRPGSTDRPSAIDDLEVDVELADDVAQLREDLLYSMDDAFDLEGALADLMDMEPLSDDEEEENTLLDVVPAGAAEPASESSTAVAPPAPAMPTAIAEGTEDIVLPDDIEPVVGLVDGDDLDIPADSQWSTDRQVVMTPVGYVRGMTSKHGGQVVGRVGMYTDKKTVYAGCHLHPKCEIKCGIVTRDVDRMKLARWLTLGVDSRGMDRAERLRLGQLHRSLWSRDGPLRGE